MFETAEVGRRLSKEDYREQVPKLRTELLQVQRELLESGVPVVVLVNGVDGAGKGEIINLLNEWMDTRNIINVAFDSVPTENEAHRPLFWRYWMALPPSGKVGFFTGAWYTRPIVDRCLGSIDDAELDRSLHRINDFEKALVDGGALVIKLWLHISKAYQRKHFKKLEKDPATAWRVTKQDWVHSDHYDEFRRVCERVIRTTSTGEAPWAVIEAHDSRHRNATVARQLVDRIRARLTHQVEPSAEPEGPVANPHTILDTLDLAQVLEKSDYKTRLEAAQGRLNQLARRARKKNTGAIIVFEGADAAGKGGAIRRMIAALDARQCQVIQVAAPTDEEKAHHYLWRFWRHLPRLGRFTIYDRSWYGRVLVERVEGFAHERDWMRAYKEINDFEEQLVEFGVVLVKFWLHISSEEQLRRFEDREKTPWKQYKITEEDYRNREKANQYEAAANDMIARTSTEYAPWTLVESEDKRFGRIKVLETICEHLEKALGTNGKSNGGKSEKRKSKKHS